MSCHLWYGMVWYVCMHIQTGLPSYFRPTPSGSLFFSIPIPRSKTSLRSWLGIPASWAWASHHLEWSDINGCPFQLIPTWLEPRNRVLGRSFDASHLHDRFRSKSHFQTATRQRVLAFRRPCSWLRPPSGCVPLPSLWWRCRARCGNRSEHDGTRVWICEVWADSQDQHARIWATRKPTIRGVNIYLPSRMWKGLHSGGRWRNRRRHSRPSGSQLHGDTTL